jgi:DNA mismatch repair protein MLH1
MNLNNSSRELMYQEGVRNFSRFAKIRFAKPLPIPDLLQLALDDPRNGWNEEDGPKEDIKNVCTFYEKIKQQSKLIPNYTVHY